MLIGIWLGKCNYLNGNFEPDTQLLFLAHSKLKHSFLSSHTLDRYSRQNLLQMGELSILSICEVPVSVTQTFLTVIWHVCSIFLSIPYFYCNFTALISCTPVVSIV